MLYVKSYILDFLQLVLGVSFDLTLDVVHKQSRFSNIISQKELKFVLRQKDGPVAINSGLVRLPTEIDSILKE